MGSKERAELLKVEVRNRILDAAMDIVMNEGFEAVSVRKIADAIDYSPRLFIPIFNYYSVNPILAQSSGVQSPTVNSGPNALSSVKPPFVFFVFAGLKLNNHTSSDLLETGTYGKPCRFRTETPNILYVFYSSYLN